MALETFLEKETASYDELAVPYYVKDDALAASTRSALITAALNQAVLDQGIPAYDYLYTRISRHSARVTAIYRPLDTTKRLPRPQIIAAGEGSYQFNARYVPKLQLKSLSTVDSVSYYAATTAPSFSRYVNVYNEGGRSRALGVTINPVVTDRIEHSFNGSTIGSTYREAVRAVVGHVNSTALLGAAAGEMIFLGLTSQRRTDDTQTLVWEFGYQANETGIELDTLDETGADDTLPAIDCDGWDHLWDFGVHLVQTEAGRPSLPVYVPRYAYCERMFPRSDLATILSLPSV